jgi:hypothetical protein
MLERLGLEQKPSDSCPRGTPAFTLSFKDAFGTRLGSVREDVTVCPACSGPMRWLEVATTEGAIAALLARHGLAPAPQRRPRAPPPGQLAFAFARR